MRNRSESDRTPSEVFSKLFVACLFAGSIDAWGGAGPATLVREDPTNPQACADSLAAAAPRDNEWRPGNYDNRYPGEPSIHDLVPEPLPFLDPKMGIVRDSRPLMGPEGDDHSQYQLKGYKQVFNPAAFSQLDTVTGHEQIFLVVRAEINTNGDVKRQSFPVLVEYREGQNPIVQKGPMLPIDLAVERNGGMEDFRAVDLSTHPASHNGVEYRKMLTYVAYDGTTPRVCGVLFNQASDFNPRDPKYVKLGPMFTDEDAMGSHRPGSAWNKSAVILQYYDSPKKLRQVAWWNEGNHLHGGVWATEFKGNPGEWPIKQPIVAGQEPVIKVRKGEYDQDLVEPSQALVAPLPPSLAATTGKKNGIYVLVHGDSPNLGYRVGYRIFDLDNPTGKPIYESKSTFLRVETPEEDSDGQVRRVVFLTGFVVTKSGRGSSLLGGWR